MHSVFYFACLIGLDVHLMQMQISSEANKTAYSDTETCLFIVFC